MARLSDQPHISVGTQGGHVEECLGRSSIEAEGCVWIGDVAVRQKVSSQALAPGGFVSFGTTGHQG